MGGAADKGSKAPDGTIKTKDLQPLAPYPFTIPAHRGPATDRMGLEMQGGYDPKGDVPKTQQDIETERLSRIADYINNYKQMQSMVLPGGNLLKSNLQQGAAAKLDPVATEDTKLQDLRRQYESSRRSWEGGLDQQKAMFKSNLELLNMVRKKMNELLNQVFTGQLVATTTDRRMRAYLEQMNNLPHDTRTALQEIVDTFFNDTIDSMIQTGSP